MMVIDPARHIAEILVAAGVEIKQPSKIKLEEIQARKIPNPKNFTCPTCGAIKGQLCRDTRNFMLKKFHDNRGSD
jgi:hypothetical protein